MNQSEKEEMLALKEQIVTLGMKLQARNEASESWRRKYGQSQNRIQELERKLERKEETALKLRKQLSIALAKKGSGDAQLANERAELVAQEAEQHRREQWLDRFIEDTNSRAYKRGIGQ